MHKTSMGAAYGAILGDSWDEHPGFFQPFKSKSHFFYNATTIVTAPITATSLSAASALTVCAELLNTFASVLAFDPKTSLDSLARVGNALYETCAYAVIAVFSPLINVVDFIGSCIKSLVSDEGEEREEDRAAFGEKLVD